MFLEGLVLFSCSIGHCSEAVDNYNRFNPEPYRVVKEAERTGEKVARKYLGSAVVNVLVPVMGWAVTQEATITLKKDLTGKLKMGEETGGHKVTVGLTWSF